MTNRVALYLGLTIAAAMALDLVANGGAGLTFLAIKFLALVEWVAFWR